MTTLGRRTHVRGIYEAEEAIAAGICKPGHLIQTGSAGTVSVHNVAGGRAERYFAVEDACTGPSIFQSASGRTVDTAYAVGDLVFGMKCPRGTVVNAILKTGVAYAVGDRLVSAGDGTLEKETALASANLEKDCIATVFDSALDLSGSGALATRHPVTII